MKNAFDLVTAFTSAILCLSSFVFVEAVEYCYDSDNVHPQNSHFSSFTAYDYVRGNELDFYSTVPCKYYLALRILFLITSIRIHRLHASKNMDVGSPWHANASRQRRRSVQ